MLSRALSLATVMLLIGSFAAQPAHAQAQNLEAGKSPSQIFAGTCSVCHKTSRGLLKTVAPGSLPGFLRQHYTTSSDMASLLSSYLISNGATDTRYGVTAPKQKDGKPETATPTVSDEGHGRKRRPAAEQEAEKPDADGLTQQGAAGRAARNAKRLPRPEPENPEATAADGQAKPTATAEEPAASGRSKRKLGKKGKPAPETSPVDAAKGGPRNEPANSEASKGEPAKGEPAKTETSKDDAAKTDSAKTDSGKGEGAKETTKSGSGSEDGKTEASRSDGKGEVPLRPDPVPAVTPAPKSASTVPDSEARPAQTASPGTSPSEPAAASTQGNLPPAASVPTPATSPTVAASAPPPAPAGPPAPPISQ